MSKLKIPSRLKKDPILESVFELRFEPARDGVWELLPGMLYKEFGSEYPETVTLPGAQIPFEVREQDPNLRFLGHTALVGDTSTIGIGQRSLQVTNSRPYLGWKRFSKKIDSILRAVKDTGLIAEVERCSLKYTNVLTIGSDDNDLSILDVSLRLDGLPTRRPGTMIRSEVELHGLTSIVQIQTSITAHVKRGAESGRSIRGVLVSVDTISQSPVDNFWSIRRGLVEKIHQTEKEVFYSLLTKSSVDAMDPVWHEEG